jgi:hypothetical protein
VGYPGLGVGEYRRKLHEILPDGGQFPKFSVVAHADEDTARLPRIRCADQRAADDIRLIAGVGHVIEGELCRPPIRLDGDRSGRLPRLVAPLGECQG